MDGKTFAYRKEIPVSADRGGRFDFDNTTALWYTKKDVIGLTAYQFTAEVTPLDKYEYKIRAEEIKTLISQKKYVEAARVADTIDWTRVKSVMMLCTVSDVYKVNRRFEDAKLLLEMANERHPSGRMILYSLCDLSIRMGDVVGAVAYYKDFEQVAPNDSGKYILQYKLYEAQDVGLEERIAVLEELKKKDYREKWAYELAYLYHRVGLATKCVEECDELILWFGEGKYVLKAMELKLLHQPLSPSQQKKFDAYMMRRQGLRVPEEPAVKEPERSASRASAAGGQEMDIQVKTMDVGKYNTINLQKELAASMKELMQEGRNAAAAEREADRPSVEAPAEEAAGQFPEGSAGYHEMEEADGQPEYSGQPEHNRQPERGGQTDYENYLSQEYDGQIGMIVPEERPMEKQITGQMNLEDIMREWEKMKRESEEKHRQELLQRVQEQTGALFRDFDETSRKGVLERLQKEERIPVDRRDRERVSRAESVISAHTKIWAAEEVQNALKAAAAVQDRQAEITPPAGMQGSEAEPSKEYADLPKEPEMIRAEEQLTEEPARRPEQAAPQANLPEQMPERLPADLPGRMPETAAVPLPEKTAEPERVEEKAPAPEPERKIERMPEPERKIERMPEPAEEKAAVSEPERIEEETPVPEPEREPEKAPETKKEPAEAEKRGTVKEGPDGGRKNGRALGERSLTGAEKRLFASFVPTKGAMKRLVAALDQISLAAYTGNLILTGEPGSDTAELAKNVIKDLKAKQPDFSGKVARVTGSALSSSRKRPEELVEKLAGGALMVEKAGEISGTCMKKLLEGLNQESWGVLIILIDTKRRIGKLLEENPEMASYFNARFDVEALDNSTLAAYGCQYARMQEYSIDELGRLALHTRIEDMQTSDHIVTVKDVREIVDEAIDHAERKTPKHLLDVLFSRRYDENNMIILHEGDFI